MTQTATFPVTRQGTAATGPAFMVAAGGLFAFDNLLVQVATMAQGQAAPAVAFWQYLAALLLSLPLLWRMRAGLRTRAPGMHLMRAALAAIGVQLWVTGLASVPIWQAIALILTSPFFVTLGAGVLLGERITMPRALSVILGLVGGLVILAPWSEAFTPQALYPLGASLFWAAQSVMTKRMTATESAESLTVWMLLLLTPVLGLMALPTGFAIAPGLPMLTVLGAGLATVIAQYLLVRAYHAADAAYLQPFDHLKLPLNVLFGWLAFGFLPEGSMWLGSAIIVAASAWLMRAETRGH